jgi:hypothetical protein
MRSKPLRPKVRALANQFGCQNYSNGSLTDMDIKAISVCSDPMLRRESHRRKLLAFLVVTLATFSAMIIGWSWSIRGYQTKAEIVIQQTSQELDWQAFQGVLADVFRTRVSDSILRENLKATRVSVPVQSGVLTGDLDELRKSLLFETRVDDDRLRIEFTVLGRGSTDEQIFLKNFTADFASTLNQSSMRDKFVVQNTQFARYHQVVDELEESIAQLERGIQEINQLCGLAEEDSSGLFRVVSHRKGMTDAKNSDLSRLKGKVADLDFEFLRSSSKELKGLLNHLGSGSEPYALPQARPVGTPQPKQLLVLLLLAGAFGVLVGTHFQPFAKQGFANLADVSNKLKIPVVVALPINQRKRNEAVPESFAGRKLPWANRLTRIATGWLLAVFILVAGFCFVSEEIRQTLFRNPVDGLARAFWFFKR